ncbi:hypothetical protein J6590_074015 [Homalodisca vitripennis]|nr:hypothetical protein J6590_074015 [Homalodisca vitripennis]
MNYDNQYTIHTILRLVSPCLIYNITYDNVAAKIKLQLKTGINGEADVKGTRGETQRELRYNLLSVDVGSTLADDCPDNETDSFLQEHYLPMTSIQYSDVTLNWRWLRM